MDQSGGLERLPRPLLCQFLSGQLAQLIVNQRQELAGGMGIARGHGLQDLRDLAHQALILNARARKDQ